MPSPFIDDLLNNLNDSEKKTINSHFSIQGSSEDLLIKRYIQEVIQPKSSSKDHLSVNRMLKSRAFDQVTDILTSNYHIHSKGTFASHDQTLLRLKKKILFARVISKSLTQNKFGPFKTILNTLITEAEKNEIYEVLIEALQLKKYYFALK